MLEEIVASGGDGVDHNALAEWVDMEVTGGTFITYLGDLRRNGLLHGEYRAVRKAVPAIGSISRRGGG